MTSPDDLKAREAAFDQAASAFWIEAVALAASTVDVTAWPDRTPEEVVAIQALQLGIVGMTRASDGVLDSEAFSTSVGIALASVAAPLSPGMSVAMLRRISEQFGSALAQILKAHGRPTVSETGHA